MNDLWNIVFSRQPGRKSLRSFGVSVPSKENIEHEAVLIYSLSQPVAQIIHEQRFELDTAFAERSMTDLNAALVHHFLGQPGSGQARSSWAE